jgi:hypothetical protein
LDVFSSSPGAHEPRGTGGKTDPPKNPGGYCGLGGTGVACPVGITG